MFCEDVAASGGYFLALAGDEIYADPSSIVGSIGVISAGFGLDKFIDRFGIQRRVHSSGKDKGALDPFQPERPEDVARLKDLQRNVHDVFIGIVKERRAGKLTGPEEELFSGTFWSAAKALDYGLIDGLADLRGKMRALHGDKVRLRAIPLELRAACSRASGGCPGSEAPTTTDLRSGPRWPMISSRPSRRGPFGRVSASKRGVGLQSCASRKRAFGGVSCRK